MLLSRKHIMFAVSVCKRKKKLIVRGILAVALGVAATGILFPPEALAGKVAAGVGAVLTGVLSLYAIVALINAFSVLLLTLAIGFFDLMVGANVYIRDLLAVNGVAYLAWTVLRDLVNAGFILIILAGAFGIIFNLPQFNARRLLIKVVLIALLVNFSFAMVQFVFAFTSSIASAFAENAKQPAAIIAQQLQLKDLSVIPSPPEEPSQLSQKAAKCSQECQNRNDGTDCISQCALHTLGGGKERSAFAQAFIPSAEAFWLSIGLFLLKTIAWGATILGLDWIITSILGSDLSGFSVGVDLLLKILYNTVAALVFFTGAIFLVIRVVAAVILAVISPLAFVAAAIPPTAHLFSRWLSALLNWAFFAPIFLFFVLISAKFTEAMQIALKTANNNNPIGPAQQPGYFLVLYIFSLAFLIGALIVTRKMSLAGASAAIGLGKMALGLATGGVGVLARRATPYVLPAEGTGMKALGRLAEMPGLRWVGGRIPQKMGAEAIERGRKAVEEQEKRTATFSKDTTISRFKTAINPEEKAALLKRIVEKEWLQEAKTSYGVTDKQIVDATKLAEGYGMHRELAKKSLTFITPENWEKFYTKSAAIPDFRAARREHMKKLTPESIAQMSDDAVDTELAEDMWKTLGPAYISAIQRQNPSLMEKLNEELRNNDEAHRRKPAAVPDWARDMRPDTYRFLSSNIYGLRLPKGAAPPVEIAQEEADVMLRKEEAAAARELAGFERDIQRRTDQLENLRRRVRGAEQAAATPGLSNQDRARRQAQITELNTQMNELETTIHDLEQELQRRRA